MQESKKAIERVEPQSPTFVSKAGLADAFSIAQSILEKEKQLHELGGRHSGIIHAHSELWCAIYLDLDLPKTGVSKGPDAWVRSDLKVPLRINGSLQIKARGSTETMHITFKTKHKERHLNWLIVMIYNLSGLEPTWKCYLMSVGDLIELVELFTEEQKGTFPLRWEGADKDTLRLDWSALFASHAKVGRVRNCKVDEKWEDRAGRATRITENMWLWNSQNKMFKRYAEESVRLRT